MRIAILTPNPFPIGNVATNRLSTYAYALAEEKCFIKVFVLKGTELKGAINNPDVKGIFNNVYYEYMSKSSIWNQQSGMPNKIYKYLYGIWKSSIVLRKDRINKIILYTDDPFYILYFGLYSKIFSIDFFIDKSEYPKVYFKKDSLYKYIYIKLFRLFDGIIVMTEELANYYTSIIRKNSKCFFLPMSVDNNRFRSIEKSMVYPPYFACLFGVHNRDCILDTIRGFSIFKKNNPNQPVKLFLIGDFENLQNRKVVDEFLVLTPAISSDIIFTGNIVSNKIPEILSNAIGLITTPLYYKSGGFPTKLGEYLATGNPVIATKVNELNKYLKHEETCLFANPGDLNQISENLEYIIKSPEKAKQIGVNGRLLVETIFNVKTYSKELLRFLQNKKD